MTGRIAQNVSLSRTTFRLLVASITLTVFSDGRKPPLIAQSRTLGGIRDFEGLSHSWHLDFALG